MTFEFIPSHINDVLMRATFFSLALLSLVPTSAAAQQAARGLGTPAAVVEAGIRDGDAAHTSLRPREAYAVFEGLLTEHPGEYDVLWRAAREAVNLGMLSADGTDRAAWYEAAEGYARRARAADPNGIRGAEWLAIALGRRALDMGPRARVRLATEIRAIAEEALSLDSLSAGAHHVLGEWHAEIRRLSGLERWLARSFLGGDVFEQASWEEAEVHLLRATELEPGGLIHHLGLAQLYLDRGQLDQARDQLREVLDRPAVEPVDPLHKQAAQDLLRES